MNKKFATFFKQKISLPIFLLMCILWIGMVFILVQQIYVLSPARAINGAYQSDRIGSESLYNAQFYGNQFYIEKNVHGQSEMLLEGTFHLIANSKNTYLLEDSSQDTGTLVVLEHDGFYFYDESQSQVVYFQLIVPLAAVKENG